MRSIESPKNVFQLLFRVSLIETLEDMEKMMQLHSHKTKIKNVKLNSQISCSPLLHWSLLSLITLGFSR
jgi:hypothetical protein